MATAAAVKDEATAHRFAKDHLKAFVERIEQLEEEKKALSDDIRDVYAEAKANGFDVKALRQVVRLRKQDVDERKEQEAILETYLQALGMRAGQRDGGGRALPGARQDLHRLGAAAQRDRALRPRTRAVVEARRRPGTRGRARCGSRGRGSGAPGGSRR